jgi:thiol-disulfide isomerase/thioredoxin
LLDTGGGIPVVISTRRGFGALAVGGTLAAALRPKQGAAAQGGGARLIEDRRPLPEFGFTDAEGASKGPADFPGKALLLNFWATWCPPCVAEMPALDRLQAMLAPEGIQVLALSSDRGGRGQVEPFYQRNSLRNLGIWLDPRGAAGRAFRIRGLPTTVLIDRSGSEVARAEGAAEWDAPAMVATIRRLAGAAPVSGETSRT